MTNALLTLLRVGLWEKSNENDLPALQACDLGGANLNDNSFMSLVWGEVLKLAEEQSVVGLVAAGVERFTACGIPLTEKLTLLGKCQLIEQQNLVMNQIVADLVMRLRKAGVYALLLKGQGVAQCYERPLWRTCGDVDLFLSDENYNRAKQILLPIAKNIGKEYYYTKHLGMTIESWSIELHGYLRCGLSKRIDQVLDEIRQDVLLGGNVRSWMNGNTQVFLPSADNDTVYIFTHILSHFYKGGIGLRQLCDWCRLLWSYRNEIDVAKLEKRLRKMGLVTEWKAFGVFAVERLGMPIEAMPMYEPTTKWVKKAERINNFIMSVGNMGHNRDMSHFSKKPYLIRKCISMQRRIGDLINHARIFPLDSLRFFPSIMFNGLRSAMRGE